jgi:geranylgeranyl diphosphate synthase type I
MRQGVRPPRPSRSQGQMQWLSTLYPRVREALHEAVPATWPEFGTVLQSVWDDAILPEAILPLAACRAVGGSARAAVPVAAALVAAVASLRLLDDLGDQDRPGQLWARVGPARAWNYAAAAQALAFDILSRASMPQSVARRLQQVFAQAFVGIAAGQDQALAAAATTLDDYWHTMEMRSGQAYAAACAAGALVGTETPALVAACATFGHHLGLTMHILNDLESIWRPDGRTDLELARVTLPLLHGLQVDHAAREELASLVTRERLATAAGRITAILDGIGTREFLIWTALREREQAIAALSACPNPAGTEALTAFITSLFGDIDQFVG